MSATRLCPPLNEQSTDAYTRSEEMDILFSVPGSARKKRQRTLEIIRGEKQEGRDMATDKPVAQQQEETKIRKDDSIV